MPSDSSSSEFAGTTPWWVVSLTAAVVAMVVAFVLSLMPIRWVWLPLIGLVTFLVMLGRNPIAWYRRIAEIALGAAVAVNLIPSISAVISFHDDSFAAFVMDGGGPVGIVLCLVAAVFGYVDYLSRRPARAAVPAAPKIDQHQTGVLGDIHAQTVNIIQQGPGSSSPTDQSESQPEQEHRSPGEDSRPKDDSPEAAAKTDDPIWEEVPFPRSKLPRTGDQLIGRTNEKSTLTRAWNNSKTCIVQIVAPGGIGKTQLVKKWRESLLDKDDHGGAVRAYDWSFYSQGTQQQASADDFFDKALRWFGETNLDNYKDPWAKGERLAELVKQQPTLLILDGMEPLQHPPGPMHGELTDPSIKALLEGLQRDNPGLCIVTTREAVPTLDEMSEPKRVTVDLDRLSSEAGAELLAHYGVTGEPDELRQASVDVDGHALALILLGTYLKARCGGDVTQRSEALLFKGHERYAAHAHKVMASYEAWFAQQDDTGRAAVAILRLMGLFNRPADAGCLAALRAEPPIPGLTEALFVGANDEHRDEVWQRAIERLRAARLLADDEASVPGDSSVPTGRQHIAPGISPGSNLPSSWPEAWPGFPAQVTGRMPMLPITGRMPVPRTCQPPLARLTAACMSTSNSPPPNCPTTSTT